MQLEVEVGRLIELVSARPELWDRAHRSREGTGRAWREVCQHLFPGFTALQDKDQREIGNFVSKRWRNVKDHYKKTLRLLREQEKNGPSIKRVQKYKYHKQLSFLLRTASAEEAGNSSDYKESRSHEEPLESIKKETVSSDESIQEIPPRLIHKHHLPMKRRIESAESISVLRLTDEERHMSFFRAILPSLIQLTEEESLQFQAGAINLLQGIKRRRALIIQQKEHTLNSAFYIKNGSYGPIQ